MTATPDLHPDVADLIEAALAQAAEMSTEQRTLVERRVALLASLSLQHPVEEQARRLRAAGVIIVRADGG